MESGEEKLGGGEVGSGIDGGLADLGMGGGKGLGGVHFFLK